MKDLYWKSAQGSIIETSGRGKMIDMTSGVICANVGHADVRLLAAIRNMLSLPLIHCYRYPFELKDRLADSLASFVKRDTSCAFFTTGAEAIEAALRIAVRWNRSKGKSRVAAFEGAFHGKTHGAALLSDIQKYKDSLIEPESESVVRLPFPSKGGRQSINFRELEDRKVGAVFVEGVQGSTMEVIDEAAFQALGSWCQENDCLLVVDEIQTGFYRAGQPLYHMQFDITPDIVVLGKGLTSSLPLSALLLGRSCSHLYDPVSDSSTHAANPLSVAAATQCLEIYNSKRFRNDLGEREREFATNLLQLATVLPLSLSLPGGLLAGISVDLARTRRSVDLSAVAESCREAGIFIADPIGVDKSVLKLMPPLTIDHESLDRALGVLGRVLHGSLEK